MSKYNSNNPAARGYDEVYLPTTSRQVDHNGKKLENILDDTEAALKARQIVTFTALEDIGVFEQNKSAEYVISRVPLNSICMFSSTRLDGEGNDWNFPEKRGVVEIRKGISGYTAEENGTRYTGVATTIVKFIGADEWTMTDGSWHRDRCDVRLTTFAASSVAHDTNKAVGSVTLEAGRYIVQFGGAYATNATGYRRVIVDRHDDLSSVTLVNKNTLAQQAATGIKTYMSGTTFFELTSETTLYLHAKQNSGSALNFTGFINVVRVG